MVHMVFICPKIAETLGSAETPVDYGPPNFPSSPKLPPKCDRRDLSETIGSGCWAGEAGWADAGRPGGVAGPGGLAGGGARREAGPAGRAGGGARRAGGWRGEAGWRVAICWLITVETPSPRIVMPYR